MSDKDQTPGKNVETQVFYLMMTVFSPEVEAKITSLLIQNRYAIKAGSTDGQTCWPGPFASFIWLHLTRQVELCDNTCASIRGEISALLLKEKIAYMNFVVTKPSGIAIANGPSPFKNPALGDGPQSKIVLVDPDIEKSGETKTEE